jgi:hypothetical protein
LQGLSNQHVHSVRFSRSLSRSRNNNTPMPELRNALLKP